MQNSTTQGQKINSDIVIAGAGFAGLGLAIALRQALGDSIRVLVCDPMLARDGRGDLRASAIAASARRLFDQLGVWQHAADQAQPILDMIVSDSKLDDAMRPVFLTFGGEIEPGEPFAHMIENGPLTAAMVTRARDLGAELRATSVADFAADNDGVTVTLADGTISRARLLVAADGARSQIREQAGIKTVAWDYGQSGIVTTVAHTREHEGRAVEHFLPAGPFAILPLRGNRSSIVWTEKADEAERIVALDDIGFHAELEKRFGLQLGEITVEGARRAYPLGLQLARSFIAQRVALAGDSAHVIHPIAGQGLNMGLRDIAALAEAIVDAARLGLDPGGDQVLARYQRWRRFDTVAMGAATDGLNRLFSNGSDVLRLVRDVGLGLVDRMPVMKNFFIREAAGLTGDVPKLLRGEAL